MSDQRRIIPRDELMPFMRRERAEADQPRCHHTIELDGTTYRCGRATIGVDRTHDGIHDAFVAHSDLGAVRW